MAPGKGWGQGWGGLGQLPGVQRAGRAGGAKRRSETQLQSMAKLALQRPDRHTRTGQQERQTRVSQRDTAGLPSPRPTPPTWYPLLSAPQFLPPGFPCRPPLCPLIPLSQLSPWPESPASPPCSLLTLVPITNHTAPSRPPHCSPLAHSLTLAGSGCPPTHPLYGSEHHPLPSLSPVSHLSPDLWGLGPSSVFGSPSLPLYVSLSSCPRFLSL